MHYLEQIRKRRAANLADKFKNKSYSETWQGVRLVALLSSFFIQAVTAFCALALPAYACKVLFGSWVVGFAVGFVLLLAFESIKANFGNFFQQLKQINVFNIAPVQEL